MPQNGYSHRKLITDLIYTIVINSLYRTTVHVRKYSCNNSYVRTRTNRESKRRQRRQCRLEPDDIHAHSASAVGVMGGFREREQRARYRCTIIVEALTHDCSAYGTWPCISLARHVTRSLPYHSHCRPHSPKQPSSGTFFSLSRDSISVSTINTVTAYVILFDNIKVSVFETIVVYILMSPVLVLAIFLRKNLSYWITLWGA